MAMTDNLPYDLVFMVATKTDWLELSQAAKYLGLRTAEFKKHLAHKIPYRLFGKHRRWHRAELDTWRMGCNNPAPEPMAKPKAKPKRTSKIDPPKLNVTAGWKVGKPR